MYQKQSHCKDQQDKGCSKNLETIWVFFLVCMGVLTGYYSLEPLIWNIRKKPNKSPRNGSRTDGSGEDLKKLREYISLFPQNSGVAGGWNIP